MSEFTRLRNEVERAIGPRRTVVALSGGIDSVVLLHVAVSLGLDVVATHVDHGLRKDSSEDARFCADLTDRLGVPFECVAIDVTRGNSTQGRARRQRYAALFRSCVRSGAGCVATAHHADDAVESAWLQAARGAGPIGRAGPLPEFEWWGFPVVRPLLEISRARIEEYASREDLDWREDPSNVDLSYRRNRLRHEVLPDALDAAEARASMNRLRAEARTLEAEVDRVAHNGLAMPNFRRFDREDLASADEQVSARLLLRTAAELHGSLSANLVETIASAIADDETETRRFTGSRIVVEVSGDRVTFEATRGQGTRLLDRRRTVEVAAGPGDVIPWIRGTVRMNERAPSCHLRGAVAGERIGDRLINDVLAEAGVPFSDRWWWPCLFVRNRCVEIVGIETESDTQPIASFLEFSSTRATSLG